MEAPTVEQITGWTKLDLDDLELSTEDIALGVERAKSDVLRWTGHTWNSIPAELEVTAAEAVQRAFELKILQTHPDVLETLGDFDLIKSFNATGYSETRRGIDETLKAKMIVPWPMLHNMLWDLATDDKKDEWNEAWGVLVPAFEVTEIDWDASNYQGGVGPSYPGA